MSKMPIVKLHAHTHTHINTVKVLNWLFRQKGISVFDKRDKMMMDGNFVNVFFLFKFLLFIFFEIVNAIFKSQWQTAYAAICRSNGLWTLNQLEPLIFQMNFKAINQIFTNRYSTVRQRARSQNYMRPQSNLFIFF